MSVNDEAAGSFRTYAKKASGHSIGFLAGWMYWLSGLLIMSSEIVVLSTFTQFWFPNVPLWLFSIIYGTLGFGINMLGVKNFGKIESLFAIIKLSTLLIFIGFGAMFLTGILDPKGAISFRQAEIGDLFPNGVIGLWSALIFIFFSFGGMAVVGVASTELKYKKI